VFVIREYMTDQSVIVKSDIARSVGSACSYAPGGGFRVVYPSESSGELRL
jgi:hypothetical protein